MNHPAPANGTAPAPEKDRARLLRPFTHALSRLAPKVAARMVLDQVYSVPTNAQQPVPSLIGGGQDLKVVCDSHVVRGTIWGTGPLIYLLHGWGGGVGQWEPLIPKLLAAGYRVAAIDAPCHGRSDPGPMGPRRSNGVEFSKALDAVANVYGPAYAVVAHSLGALATMLTIRSGQLLAENLVFLAPMAELRAHLETASTRLGLSDRTRSHIDATILEQTGVGVDECNLVSLARPVDTTPLLIVHDLYDRRQPVGASAAVILAWPAAATLITTEGLGHSRLLADASVHSAITNFLHRQR